MSWERVFVSEFLSERKNRYKPEEANESWLNRLEKIDFSWVMHIKENKQTKTNMILIRKWDLVISWINVEKGALSVYEGRDDILATIHYSSYEYDKNKIDIEYLKYFLKSPSFQKLLLEQNGWGIKTEMKAKTFLKLKVFLPELLEQEKIVKQIRWYEGNILKLQSITTKNLSYISSLRSSILQDAIAGKLTEDWRKENIDIEPASELLKKIQIEKQKLIAEKKLKKQKDLKDISPEEIPFEIPESWEWCRLGEVVKNIYWWGTPDKWNPSFWKDGTINWASVKDLNEEKFLTNTIDKITELAISSSSTNIVEKWNIIISTRMWLWKILISKITTCINQDLKCIELPNLIDTNFFFNLYKTLEIKWKWWVTVEWIRQEELLNILIPLPPLEEQKEIVRIVDEKMELCKRLEAETQVALANAEKLMKSVLGEVFRK